MRRTVAALRFGKLRGACEAASILGRPASVEPADILLLLDRYAKLESVALAASAFRLSHKPVGMSDAEFLAPERSSLNTYGSSAEARLHRALSRLTTPKRAARGAKG